jgi:outer membrane receptor for ferrienterochelin and colicins
MPPDRRARLAAALAAAAVALAPARVHGDAGRVEVGDLDLESLLDMRLEAVALHAERSSEASASVFVLSAEDLRRQGLTTLQAALATVPGFFAYADGLYPMVGVRGMGLLADWTTRLLVLVDGHPLNNSLAIGQSYLGRDLPVPLAAVQRIEVVKGPVGSLYGPTAFYGVVNLVTAGGAPRFEAALRTDGAQAHLLGGEASLVASGRDGPVSWLASAAGFDSGGLDLHYPELAPLTPGGDGRVTGVDFSDALQAYARAAAGDLTLSAACGRFRRGVPTAPYSSVPDDPRNRVALRTCFVDVGFSRALVPGFTIDARAAYDDFAYGDTFAYAPPPEGFGLFHDDGRDRWGTLGLRGTWRPWEGGMLVAGATGEAHDTLQHTWADGLPTLRQDPVAGVGVGPIPKSYLTLNVYLLAQQDLARTLHLHAGLTSYRHALFGSQLTPKLAAVWEPTADDALKALWSVGFRAPTAGEAFFDDGVSYLPNPALRPETVRSLELSWTHRLGGVASLGASLFQNEHEGLIRFQNLYLPDPARPDPNDPLQYRQIAQNVASMRLRGGELSAAVRWGDLLQAWGGISAQALDVPQPNFPAVTANLAVSSRALWRPLTLAVNGAFVATRAKDPTLAGPEGAPSVPPAVTVNAWATLEVPGGRGLALEGGVQNLLGAAAADPVPADFAPIAQLAGPPRTFRAGVRWRF